MGIALTDNVADSHSLQLEVGRRAAGALVATGTQSPQLSIGLPNSLVILAALMYATLLLISLHSWANLNILFSVEPALCVQLPREPLWGRVNA